ncbi:Protein of unknown function [Thermobacillus xylanilyticus]|uniref:Uncharacterized protein n=1 Tax=Thermobacillus xylanilyticus TaxID=76633 RepID=A0ABM8V6M5_THEXY|nr:Protein of unknown function [Thermobacillus xylanilyticus]
MLTAMLQPE